jgi:hypothetical protein
MKVDQETLAKNRFWIGLGIFLPLWLIALIIVLVSCSKQVADGKKKVEDAQNKLKSINDPKNENYIKPVQKKKDELEQRKDSVWDSAWQTQKELMTWPSAASRPTTQQEAAKLEQQGFFGQQLDYGYIQDYAQDLYKNQFRRDEIVKALSPVQGNWDALVRRVPFNASKVPSEEECWLAQEDLWVQRELLNIVKAAQDSVGKFENVALFKPVEIPEKELKALAATPEAAPGAPEAPGMPAPGPGAGPAAGAVPGVEPGAPEGEAKAKSSPPVRRRFVNPDWQLDLVVERNAQKQVVLRPESKLTNISTDPRRVDGLTFLLKQQVYVNRQPTLVQATPTFAGKAGEILAPKASVGLKTAFRLPDTFVPGSPFDVELAADTANPVPKDTYRQRFRSPNWEIELNIVLDKSGQPVITKESKIKNVNTARRTLSLGTAEFRVHQGQRGGTSIRVPSEPLPWGQAVALGTKDFPAPFLDRQLPIQIDQVFNPITSPVKRVQALALAYHSHKTSYLPLKPAKQFAPKEGEQDTTSTPAGSPTEPGGGLGSMTGGPPGGMVPPSLMGPGGGGGMLGTSSKDVTPNYGLNRSRYIIANDQVRRMPVALSVILDQAYIPDLLTAVTNSRLRIQITQVQWQHAPGAGATSGTPFLPGGTSPGEPPGGGDTDDDKRGTGKGPFPPAGGGLTPPGVGGMAPGAGMRPPGGTFPPGMFPGGGMGLPGTTGQTEESDPNLVEVAVYGIASLYERYPPPKPQDQSGTGGNSGTTTTP